MIELFDFCQYSFDLLNVQGFVLQWQKGNIAYFILFKAIAFHHGWHKWVENPQDDTEPNYAQNSFCSLVQGHGWVCLLWELLLFLSCTERWVIHDSVNTPALTAPAIHYLVIVLGLRLNWHKKCYLKKFYLFYLFISLMMWQCNPQLSPHVELKLRVGKSHHVLNAQRISSRSSLPSMSCEIQYLLLG